MRGLRDLRGWADGRRLVGRLRAGGAALLAGATFAAGLALGSVGGASAAYPAPGGPPGNGTLVTGFVYYDLNGNGRWDPGEPRAPNAPLTWTVQEPGAKGNPASADANGNYTIDLSLVSAEASPDHPYAIGARGVNAVGDILGGTNVVAEGATTFYVPGNHIAAVDIGLHFVGSTNEPTHFPLEGSAFINYFDHRGGVATFGYPVSRLFLFQGYPTQIFQRAVLQQWPDGSVHLLNLLDPGLLPFDSFNGAVVPAFDPGLVAQAPAPGSPDYADQAIAFVDQNVPDTFAGLPVGFHRAFFGTVTAGAAFPPIPPPSYCQQRGLPASSCTTPPGYGDSSLLPGFDLEIWGLPTSHPAFDPNNHQFVYQRFQRGILHYQGNVGATEGLLLGDYFKAVLTGQDLPLDLAQEAAGSRYLDQYCPAGPHWICRPSALDPATTDLTGAFAPEPPVH